MEPSREDGVIMDFPRKREGMGVSFCVWSIGQKGSPVKPASPGIRFREENVARITEKVFY
jgi:hypothetical protein